MARPESLAVLEEASRTLEVEELCYIQNLLKIKYPGEPNEVSVLRPGVLYINGVGYKVDNVLLDSGAIHKSYINVQFLNRYREILSEKIKKASGNVKLGDNIATKKITEIVELELRITDAKGNSQAARLIW